jgi:hypothetical protein
MAHHEDQKDTKRFDDENPNFGLFVAFVVTGIICSWITTWRVNHADPRGK